MLFLEIPTVENYNEFTNEFSTLKGKVLRVEHSLVSLSKWESKHCKPFLSDESKTLQETVDYIIFMTVTPNVNFELYRNVNQAVIDKVSKYIDAPMTATTFRKNQSHKLNKDVVTAEIIYYWMITLGIPFECQKWHLNRLLTLINVCNIKNQPKKGLSGAQVLARNRAINTARRKQLNTRG